MTNSDAGTAALPAPPDAVLRLSDVAGHARVATADDVAAHLARKAFFWLDLEAMGQDDLVAFCRALHLPADLVDILTNGTPQSSFTHAAASVVAVLPWITGTDLLASEEASYLSLVLNDQFLLTVHSTPCEPLERAARTLASQPSINARESAPRLLFSILDFLIDSFKPQILAIDDRLGEVQLELLRGGTVEVHDELISLLGALTEGIQELGWYTHDLEDIADDLDGLPGMRAGSRDDLQQHRNRVTRIRDNAREVREEAKDALSHYSASLAGRQAVVINGLTIVATVFLPLSFLTGYFGMNFTVLVSSLGSVWSFVLMAVLLPLISAALSLTLIHRLERRLGISKVMQPPP